MNPEEPKCLFEGVCVNYRHPAPRRGKPRVRSTRPESISAGSAGSGGSGSELREVTFYAQASQTLQNIDGKGRSFLAVSQQLLVFIWFRVLRMRPSRQVSIEEAHASL